MSWVNRLPIVSIHGHMTVEDDGVKLVGFEQWSKTCKTDRISDL
jgi:hypothetical protein